MLLLTPLLTFYGISNDYVLSGTFLFGIWSGGILIRIIYYLSDNYGSYTAHAYLPVVGMKFYRVLSILTLICSIILSYRISSAIDSNQYLAYESLSKSWWVIIRILLTALCTLLAFIYDSHYIFRITTAVLLPCLALIDICSELYYHLLIECIERGICVDTIDYTVQQYYLLSWRDLISASLFFTSIIISYWLNGLLGIISNELFIPRLEHRELTVKLDKLHIGPKLLRRKKEDGGLAKMMGF